MINCTLSSWKQTAMFIASSRLRSVLLWDVVVSDISSYCLLCAVLVSLLCTTYLLTYLLTHLLTACMLDVLCDSVVTRTRGGFPIVVLTTDACTSPRLWPPTFRCVVVTRTACSCVHACVCVCVCVSARSPRARACVAAYLFASTPVLVTSIEAWWLCHCC